MELEKELHQRVPSAVVQTRSAGGGGRAGCRYTVACHVRITDAALIIVAVTGHDRAVASGINRLPIPERSITRTEREAWMLGPRKSAPRLVGAAFPAPRRGEEM